MFWELDKTLEMKGEDERGKGEERKDSLSASLSGSATEKYGDLTSINLRKTDFLLTTVVSKKSLCIHKLLILATTISDA